LSFSIRKSPSIFLQAEDVPALLEGAAEVSYIVDQGFGQVAGLSELVDRRGSMALGELMPILSQNHGKMAELGHLPAEGIVHDPVERCRRKPFLRPHHLGNAHKMIVDDVCQMVGREAVRLEEDGIGADVLVLPLDPPQELVLEYGRSLHRYLETDDGLLTLGQELIDLALAQVSAMPVVALVA
jgi:hypothetical protein